MSIRLAFWSLTAPARGHQLHIWLDEWPVLSRIFANLISRADNGEAVCGSADKSVKVVAHRFGEASRLSQDIQLFVTAPTTA